MAIHRVIFRLDFNLNYRIVDYPGKVMETITSLGDAYWDGITDAQKDRAIGGTYTKGDPPTIFRTVTVQPKSFVFALESVEGISGRRGGADDDFSSLCDLADRFADEFKVQELGRAGIRCWHLNSIRDGASLVERFTEHVSAGFVEAVKSGGQIRDLGISFDGSADDRFKYHVRCGPLLPDEIKTRADHFPKISEKLSATVPANIIFDVDHYEESFSLKGRHPSSWARAQFAKSIGVITAIEKAIKSGEGK